MLSYCELSESLEAAAFFADELTFGDFLAHGSNFGASIAKDRLADFRLTICSCSDSSLELDAENCEESPESELLTFRFYRFLGSVPPPPAAAFLPFFSVFAPPSLVAAAFLDAAGTLT